MSIISKRRVLRPSTRMPDSPYRVKAEDVGPVDILQLTVSHENNPEKPIGVFEFRGSDIGDKKIHLLHRRKGRGIPGNSSSLV